MKNAERDAEIAKLEAELRELPSMAKDAWVDNVDCVDMKAREAQLVSARQATLKRLNKLKRERVRDGE